MYTVYHIFFIIYINKYIGVDLTKKIILFKNLFI